MALRRGLVQVGVVGRELVERVERVEREVRLWVPAGRGDGRWVRRQVEVREDPHACERMIIWGGGFFTEVDTGALYNPIDDSWAPTSTGVNVPHARGAHTSVWTGAEMIIWGGGMCDRLTA
jgi:hypothetical protein